MKKRTKVKKQPDCITLPYTGPKIGRYDDNWNLLETFQTLTDCRKAGYKNAQEVLKGNREHCKGYRFKYLD